MSVQYGKENANMKIIRLGLVVSALSLLGACVAVPVNSGYYGGPPAAYAPAPAYYAPPVYFGPSFGIGIYGGGRGRGHGHY
jgi:hypothetical protein